MKTIAKIIATGTLVLFFAGCSARTADAFMTEMSWTVTSDGNISAAVYMLMFFLGAFVGVVHYFYQNPSAIRAKKRFIFSVLSLRRRVQEIRNASSSRA